MKKLKQNIQPGMLIRHRTQDPTILLVLEIVHRRHHSAHRLHDCDALIHYMYAGDDVTSLDDGYICTCCYEVLR